MWDKIDKTATPDLNTIAEYINSPYWDEFYSHMAEHYNCKPKIEYSACTSQKGWNLKFKKSSKSLCTVYPLQGSFIAMIVLGDKEMNEVSIALPSFTDYIQTLYEETNPGKDSKWLMVEIQNAAILKDAFELMGIRYNCTIKPKKSTI